MTKDIEDPITKEVIELCKEAEASSLEKFNSGDSEFKLQFADSFIESFSKILKKTPEQLDQEETELNQKLFSYLKTIEDEGLPVKVYTNGYLYGQEITDGIDEFMETDPEAFGFSVLPNGKYTWKSSWTDIFLFIDEERRTWFTVVENKDALESQREFDTSINNECLQEAYADKDLELIKYYQEEGERLNNHFSSMLNFRNVVLDTTNYLTKDSIIEGIQTWLFKFYPSLSGRKIELISRNH